MGKLFTAALLALALAGGAAAQDKAQGEQPARGKDAREKGAKEKGAKESGASKLKIEPGQRYLVLETVKTSTMQKELDEAAARGFRVVFGAPTAGAEMVILLERAPEGSEPYRYRLLATTRTKTMQKEINDVAAEGYRLLPRTVISKEMLFGSIEAILVLERAPGNESRYEYKLFSTESTSKLQKEVAEAEAEGYVVTGIVSRGDHLVILEKETRPGR